MVRIARQLRVSNKTQEKALERMRFGLEQTVLRLGGSLDDSPIFEDICSGRKETRAGLLKMLAAIEAREIDIIVTYRVDRLVRDLEISARLAKLLERTGVRLYDFQKEDFVDFGNPEDWESYAHKSVSAESESRRMSKRIRSGFEFARHKGSVWRVPWGYVRNRTTEKPEINPTLEPVARDTIAVLMETRNFQQTCRIITERWGKQWIPISLRRWIFNPVLRGHIGYGVVENRQWTDIRYNTHPEHAILTEDQFREIEAWISEHQKLWGANSNRTPRPLSGSVYCGRCSAKMAIARSGGTLYFSCRSRIHDIGATQCSLSRTIRYEDVEAVVIETLRQAADTIADVAMLKQDVQQKSQRLLELEALLTNLNKMGDNPLLDSSKAEIRNQIAAVKLQESGADVRAIANREALRQVFSTELDWLVLPQEEKRHIFKAFVQRVTVDVEEITIGTTIRSNRPKQRLDWTLDVTLYPLGIQFPGTSAQQSIRHRLSRIPGRKNQRIVVEPG